MTTPQAAQLTSRLDMASLLLPQCPEKKNPRMHNLVLSVTQHNFYALLFMPATSAMAGPVL